MRVTLTSYTPNPEQAIIEAAATCWKSVPREEILHHIIQAGHWTPLEFAVFNFRIEGISRACSHQLVRKRVGVAFAQESQRYTTCTNQRFEFDYVTPKSILESSEASGYWALMTVINDAYKHLLNAGIPPEDARFVLPNACTTTISMSINYHALLDLARERLCNRAQWEISGLLEAIKAEVKKVSPVLAGYLQPKCYWLKYCPEKKSCGRVVGKGSEEREVFFS